MMHFASRLRSCHGVKINCSSSASSSSLVLTGASSSKICKLFLNSEMTDFGAFFGTLLLLATLGREAPKTRFGHGVIRLLFCLADGTKPNLGFCQVLVLTGWPRQGIFKS